MGQKRFLQKLAISIHALLAESDGIGLVFMWWGVRFLSTLSLRRATANNRTEQQAQHDFYPRSPCGERPEATKSDQGANTHRFLSTLSLRRATARRASRQQPAGISIHALLAESDAPPYNLKIHHKNFYPRSPCGERLIHPLLCNAKPNFYPRSPCGERPDPTKG